MPAIGDPVGPKYTLREAYPNSPRLRAALEPWVKHNSEQGFVPGDSHYAYWVKDDHKPLFKSDWYIHVSASTYRGANPYVSERDFVQRRFPIDEEQLRRNAEAEEERLRREEEQLTQKLTQKAFLEPTVKYALMPKLEELQEQLNDVRNKQAELSEAQITQVDDLSNTLADMSIKAGNADDRLDLVEQKTMAMGKKLDTIQRDVNEIKTMVAEIHAALRRPSSSRN